MKISFSPPDISQLEIDEVVDTLKSGWITTGPKTKKFENDIAKFCGTSKAVCLNSATAGLELVLRIFGVGKGDEVITSAYTYSASASVIEHVGAKIVLCDCQKDNYEIDYHQLESLVTEKTKVIVPVDVGGIMCDYDKLREIVAKKQNLFHASENILQQQLSRILILTDGAHSLGATSKGLSSGQAGDFTSFSFHAVKNLTTAEGGAVTWRQDNGFDDEWIYKQFMLWSLHGQSKDALAKTQIGAWEYDIKMCGQKCNMTDIMASIGIAQLSRYDAMLKRRKAIIEKYNQAFENLNVELPKHYGKDFSSSGHLFLVRLLGADEQTRNDVVIELAKRGIATNVHYKPLPMHTAYKNLGFDIANFPNAYARYKNEITLPLHTCLTDEEVDFIIKNFVEVVKSL